MEQGGFEVEFVAEEKARLFQVVSQLNSERRSIVHRAIASHFAVDEQYGAKLVKDGATDHQQFCEKINAMVDQLIDYTDAAKVAVTGEFLHQQVQCAYGSLADMNQISNLKAHISELRAQNLTQQAQIGAQQAQVVAQQNMIGGQHNQIGAQQNLIGGQHKQIGGLHAQVVDQQNRIGGLHAQVADQQNLIGGQHKQIGDLQARNTALLAQNSSLRKRKLVSDVEKLPSQTSSGPSKLAIGVSETTVGPSTSIVGASETTVEPSKSADDLSQTGESLPSKD